METLEIEAFWSNTITKDCNDCGIIVTGTDDKELALQLAKELFKKDVTDINGCVAYSWGSETYPKEYAETVFVWMSDVG